MSALNLPRPVNTYAGEDELLKTNGLAGRQAVTVEETDDIGEYRPPRMSDKYKAGIIYPPPEMRKMIDKTATAVSKTSKPQALEDKIKESQKTDPRFAFLNDEDPYHQYYRYMVEIKREEAEDIAKGIAPAGTPGTATPAAAAEPKDEGPVYEPKALEFKVDLPGVTAQDLDILRLTALFHARRGRSFLEALSVREGRNYQFDFLRPTHSMFGYYNRMVESYQKIMHPPPGLIASVVEANADPEAKWKTLEEGRLRADWERARRKKEDEKAKEKDEEAQVFAEIDWQDFVTVETIEFTQADMELDLPPPTNVDKLRVMSMAEKRMAAMIMEEPGAGVAAPGGADNVEEVDMEEDEDDEEARLQRIKEEKEQARARDVQRAALESKGLKIKKDYVAKGIQRGGNVATAKCPYCGQSIPESELSEHIRIELLDPRWKDQKRDLEQRRQQQQQLQIGADISKSLKDLATNRTDLFGDESDEALKARRDAEAEQKRKDREKIVWDGHTNSAKTAETTFQSRYSAEDAARRRNEAMGISDKPVNTVGPQVGPGIQAQAPQQPIMKAPPSASTGTTISAGPTGPSSGPQPTYFSAQGGAASAGPSINPARQAMMSGGAPQQQAGQVRSAPDDGHSERAFKRPRVAKLPAGQLYSEFDWMSLHPDPITLSVQLPTMPDKPEWKLDGSIVSIPDLHVNTLFSTLRERIKRALDADLPISRLRIDYNSKVMSNGATLASVNLDDGDMVVMAVRKK
ncbi:SF3a splicing factor complex subunit [Vanrija albida]|uniref:SF3a splicing factor complex subunit n=1 Tax=Vanrija albida TaxID=181172 RepID=A0ABR3PYH3_9TREE